MVDLKKSYSFTLELETMHGNYLRIGCLWRPCFLPLLLLLGHWGCPGTAPRHHPSCLPMSASMPRPVLGFWELQRRGTGCTSREHSTLGQEVHVISLRGGVPANAQVTLILDSDPLHRAPIFVLHSQEPLHWMLPSPPGKNWTFQVSPGSHVSALGPVASAEITFPETSRSLLQWARREHGGVTSLAEYHGVNTIYTHLGADGTAPTSCKLRRNFVKSAHFASERRLQPLQICLNPNPPQDVEVHIIFSKGAASRGLAHLTVELHALRRAPRRGLFLILKSEGIAQWMVHAHHLTGQLHVWASHKVVVSSTEMDLSLTVTQRTSSGLARVTDPLQWVARQKLPGFTSYTEAEHVNRFLLIAGLNGAASDPKPFGPMFLPPTRFTETQQRLPEAVTLGWARRQEFLAEDSTSLLLLPTAKTGTEGMESILCPGEQKPSHENKDIQSVSCVSPSSTTQASLPEATMAFQDLPFHLGNVLLSLEVYNSEAFAKQPGPCVVSANSRVFVECQSENEACKGGEELASGRFQRTITKPIIVTVEIPPRAAAPHLKPDHYLLNQQGKTLKDVNHSRKTQPVPTIAAPHLELPAVIGIAFSAFIIGISLTGGLWFIHSQTSGCEVAHSITDPEETAVPKPQATSSAPTVAGPACSSPP
ncbi:transforming growth factor beta receptor type 3-like isoform X3 [Eublepharis macularius]|uniref:Transforming growth factor beta receptor type 3-like isoform X3 n=1 Tax=Eublepharis macularius TaxID=481883 RepID=A0AA97JAE2_EUBMA|nr:transforming growth factor beta receptor type 3-like isoform X3 [Eublepharis macularius]